MRRGWEPGRREWDDDLGADPVAWVGRRLSDLDTLLARSDIDPSTIDPGDTARLRDSVPEILDAVRKLLERVWAGELGNPPDGYVPTEEPVLARAGWL